MKQRPKAAIVGAGHAGFTNPDAPTAIAPTAIDPTAIAMASQALTMALADANLRRDQIDGLVVHIGSPRGTDYDLAASQLGLKIRFAAQPWAHGRFGATVLQHACMAVAMGLADRVLCLAAYNNPGFGTHGTKSRPGFQESLRDGGGPHAETPHAGMTAPAAGAAMAAQRYFHRHQLSPDDLAAIAIAHRRHATLNPLAKLRTPLTREAYLASRTIIEPLRLFDCSILVDGAVALIITRDDLAANHARPVDILGFQGIHAGPNEFIFGQPGLGTNQADIFDFDPRPTEQTVYRMSGLTPSDVDAFYLYDAFTPLVLWALERFGHCRVGEAMAFVQHGAIEIGGRLPVNTNGGMLSEGHLNGWGHFLEIVAQLRNAAGPRQVPGAKVAQWGTCIGDSILFGARGQT